MQYLYTAIEHDPKIEDENRESILLEAIKCKTMFSDEGDDKEALKQIKEAHFLLMRDDDDEIS